MQKVRYKYSHEEVISLFYLRVDIRGEHRNGMIIQKDINEADFQCKDQQFISIPSRLSEPFIHDFFFILMIEDMHSMMKLSRSVRNKTYEFNIAWLFPTKRSQKKNNFRFTSFLS